jgi:hypothetical protein
MDPMATARMGRIYASSWWCYTDTKADTYLDQGVDDLTGGLSPSDSWEFIQDCVDGYQVPKNTHFASQIIIIPIRTSRGP